MAERLVVIGGDAGGRSGAGPADAGGHDNVWAAGDCVEVLAERRTGRLLGAQIVGLQGSAKRIDVAATALWNGMTVEEMTALDLGYAPPFLAHVGPRARRSRKAADTVHEAR